MFKKIAALLLVLALMSALAACGGGSAPSESPIEAVVSESPAQEQNPSQEPSPEPSEPEEPVPSPALDTESLNAAYETYSLVTEKLTNTSGEDAQYDIDYAITMGMSFMGETQSFDMDGNIKMKVEGDKVLYSMVMDMGEEFGGVMEMYCDGQKAYYVVGGEVTEVDMAELVEQITSSVSIPEFEKEAIKSFAITDVSGGTETSFVISGEALSKFIEETMGSELESLGTDLDMTISDIDIAVTSDDAGNPVSMGMSMNFSIVVEGEVLEIDSSHEYIFNKLGSGVDIDLSAINA